jgi:phosphoribosyl 1,2-cyclic phosphodiesterase
MKLSILASGSSGNSVYIESDKTRVLVDAGLSGQDIASRLNNIGVSPDSIGHVVITHEHSDHISGAGIFARRYNIPLYLHPRVRENSQNRLGRINQLFLFESDEAFDVGEMVFEPFSVSHDAVSPVGFCIHSNGNKIALTTDLGIATNLVVEKIKKSDILIIESNHDEELLIDGPYPWYLKQRIRSNVGHLSNTQSNELLERVWHDGIKHVYLAHMSKVNNIPQIAYKSAIDTVKKITDSDKYTDIVHLTTQDEPTSLIDI